MEIGNNVILNAGKAYNLLICNENSPQALNAVEDLESFTPI